jgi:molybdenum cofactor sulfurtransferase
LIERFAADLTSNLVGNPHSTSMAAQNTSKRIERIRLRLLRMFNADPEDYDVVFVANATAGIKLVAEAFRDAGDFWYGYHRDCHTSLVGVRELAKSQRCFESDLEVERWLCLDRSRLGSSANVELFAYTAQSNMNGRRLPLDWCSKIRNVQDKRRIYTLLDAAALVSTAPLDLSNSELGPDFTVLSLYKIFGFPDLGALIVRKASGDVFQKRKYFGGGTVDMVACLQESWHARKLQSIHEELEDGSLPVHNIMALDSALDVHSELFGSLEKISRHCAFLANRLHDGLSRLRHSNNRPVCQLYHKPSPDFCDLQHQGPVLAFNLRDSKGTWIDTAEVEKLASVKSIQLRTGGLCNPGGVALALSLSAQDMKRNFAAGQRCDNEHGIMHGRPTGMIRVSLGPENTLNDIDSFLSFVGEFFVDGGAATPENPLMHADNVITSNFHVESLMIYPIKSCAGWRVPPGKAWGVHKEGLAWDREWCIILSGSGTVMSQKRYPRMALIRPTVDVDEGLLRVAFGDTHADISPITIPLFLDPSSPMMRDSCSSRNAKVCGDDISARTYDSIEITNFFTKALGIPCQLGRFPAGGSLASSRHTKPHLQPSRVVRRDKLQGGFSGAQNGQLEGRPILLSNESPVLTISRSSLNRLNEQIKSNGGKAVRTEVFRANIVLAENSSPRLGSEHPYAEDQWRMMRIGSQDFELLGPCRRCHMVNIDQDTGTRSAEPFVTLAKTRRRDGKIYFGQHACHVPGDDSTSPGCLSPTIAVGDRVTAVQVA